MSSDANVSAYRIVHDGLLALHHLHQQNRFDSDEAESVRAEMDEPWLELDDGTQDLLSGLSRDLNDVKNIKHDAGRAEADPRLMSAIDLQHAGRLKESLELLRRHKDIPPFSRISYYRGRCWQDANEPKTALVFFNHAIALNSTNEHYRASALAARYDAFPADAAVEAATIMRKALATPWPSLAQIEPLSVLTAAEIMFSVNGQLEWSSAEAVAGYNDIVNTLRRVQSRLSGMGATAAVFQPAHSVIYTLLATSHRRLGELDMAFDAYTSAIGLDPFNSMLQILRGAMLYGRSPFAVEDFGRATALGSDLAVPYYLLAHHSLTTNQFAQAIMLADEGLKRKASNRLRSELLEYKAIALAGSQGPEADVMAAFDAAKEADSSNDRVDFNRGVFLHSFVAPTLPPTVAPKPPKFNVATLAGRHLDEEIPRSRNTWLSASVPGVVVP